VLGKRQPEIVHVSEQIARVVKQIPGAVGVVSDPIRGKGYVDIHLDRQRAADLGIDASDAQDAIEAALGGLVATHTVEGRRGRPVRVRFARPWREDEESLGQLPIAVHSGSFVTAPLGAAGSSDSSPAAQFPVVLLEQIADVRVVDGPATIKGENGLLRNYVRLNVRDRDASEFVSAARRAVARQVVLPAGVSVEWVGQFEHQERSTRTLLWIVPAVLLTILLILYLTYRDLADALLMLLAVPGALAGGVLLQWLLGEKLTVTLVVGYIACFGMATATGVIMLVYLREAVEKAGGLAALSPERLRQAVLDGAVHRLRPKLLTEATTIIGLAPLLWAHGVGAEVIRPMAVPVLGGILIADEVIDLFLPVMFYWVRRQRLSRLQASDVPS
jgi:Cu(I)/Ag(I) efflux system membrane protein CusA/SilA